MLPTLPFTECIAGCPANVADDNQISSVKTSHKPFEQTCKLQLARGNQNCSRGSLPKPRRKYMVKFTKAAAAVLRKCLHMNMLSS